LNRSEPAARCYAEALILLAREKGRLPAVRDDLRAVLAAFRGAPKVWALFTSPRVEREQKEAIVRKAFAGKVGPEVMGLLVVLVRKSREPIYDNVVDQFERFQDLEQNRVHVRVRSARPLDAGVRDALVQAVAASSGKTPVVHEETDAALLGGMVVRVGDVMVDGTLRSRLESLRRRMAGDN
jgi:F-type H+-transporting ATPase subunit delta